MTDLEFTPVVPSGVRHVLRMSLGKIQLAAESVAQGREMGARYEAEVYENLDQRMLAEAHGYVWRFRQVAAGNGFDAEALISELGGLPLVELSDRARGFFRGGF
jgi:hypothetical protein